jgi:hypothetical protein
MRMGIVSTGIFMGTFLLGAGCNQTAGFTADQPAENSRADRTTDAKLVGVYEATGTPRPFNSLELKKDGTFNAGTGCPGDGPGAHCFLIGSFTGTWKSTRTQLTLTDTVATPTTKVYTYHAQKGALLLAGDGKRFLLEKKPPNVPACTADADCDGKPIFFTCGNGTHGGFQCLQNHCSAKCLPSPPTVTGTCAAKHGRDGACIASRLLTEDGCGRGSVDQTASCDAQSGEAEVCCVAPAPSVSGNACIFDSDCPINDFCFRPRTLVNIGGIAPRGVCTPHVHAVPILPPG